MINFIPSDSYTASLSVFFIVHSDIHDLCSISIMGGTGGWNKTPPNFDIRRPDLNPDSVPPLEESFIALGGWRQDIWPWNWGSLLRMKFRSRADVSKNTCSAREIPLILFFIGVTPSVSLRVIWKTLEHYYSRIFLFFEVALGLRSWLNVKVKFLSKNC